MERKKERYHYPQEPYQDIWPFLFCTLLGDLDKPGGQANFFEISNGRKISRMALISMIFGSIETRWCKLKLYFFRAVETNSARAKTSKNFRKKFEKEDFGSRMSKIGSHDMQFKDRCPFESGDCHNCRKNPKFQMAEKSRGWLRFR